MSEPKQEQFISVETKAAVWGLIIAAMTGSGVGTTISLYNAPDLEIAKREAVDIALEKMRAEVDREIAPMRSRLERIEEKLDRLIEREQ